jgi:O-antigen ligase
MAAALVLTASRAGFIDLIIAGSVSLWYFGVKGKRPQLITGAAFFSLVLLLSAGNMLEVRFAGIFNGGNSGVQDSAHESYEERRFLMIKSLEAIARYPILGVGAGDFVVYSGIWKDVHASYLQIAADGGIPALILYLMFFSRGFSNLRLLGRMQNLDGETVLFAGALKSSLIGFVVGACFAPEAYQLFPYFTVCYTSVLLAIAQGQKRSDVALTKSFTLPLRRLAKAY